MSKCTTSTRDHIQVNRLESNIFESKSFKETNLFATTWILPLYLRFQLRLAPRSLSFRKYSRRSQLQFPSSDYISQQIISVFQPILRSPYLCVSIPGLVVRWLEFQHLGFQTSKLGSPSSYFSAMSHDIIPLQIMFPSLFPKLGHSSTCFISF